VLLRERGLPCGLDWGSLRALCGNLTIRADLSRRKETLRSTSLPYEAFKEMDIS
jgi:hypothetical protein